MGYSANTPMHSCKLTTTLLRMLTSTYDINSLKQWGDHRFPFSDKLFAHSFCMLVSHLEGKLYCRIYQAFGPPNIGYSLTECIYRGYGSKLLLGKDIDILDFINGYKWLECYTKWSSKVQNDYQ